MWKIGLELINGEDFRKYIKVYQFMYIDIELFDILHPEKCFTDDIRANRLIA